MSKAGKLAHLTTWEAQSEARGLGVRQGKWTNQDSLPDTREPLSVFGQRRPGSAVCLRMMMVLVVQGRWGTACGSP